MTNKPNQLEAIPIPWAEDMSFGILVAEWHHEITFPMRDAAISALLKYGANKNDILVKYVPGSFELILGSQLLAENSPVDAIIAIGCLIKGETPHFHYICQSVSQGIAQVNLDYSVPVIFGVLTTDTIEQAKDRAGGKYGNKGEEAAIAAIKMVALHDSLCDDESEDDENY